jgi:hypothetical protein
MAVLNEHQAALARPAADAANAADAAEAVAAAEEGTESQLALVGAPSTETAGNGSTGATTVGLPRAAPVQVAPAAEAQPAVARPGGMPLGVPLGAVHSGAGRVAALTGRPASMTLLYIWMGLFGFVGTQLAWTLRPFFGSPGSPFEIFRDIDGTFYGDIFATIGRLLGG